MGQEIKRELLQKCLVQSVPDKKKFLFKKRSGVDGSAASNITPTVGTTGIPAPCQRDECITVDKSVYTLNNLDHCVVVSPNATSKNQSGSWTLANISNSIVVLKNISFARGSVFMTHCEDSVIIVEVPPKNTVQVRLHSFTNCKVEIRVPGVLPDAARQNVVIEGFKDTVFNSNCERFIKIQNFSDLGFGRGTDESSQFEPFDSFGDNITSLKHHYISRDGR
ncbi:GTPase-activating protein CIN2 KNAG_0D00800 [Huiozyma naganishii CBS 8797]|uniref:Tubulin binding cofactor C-like domain-containing protein n=1 Tax=Huiozyma naganishii (strain ATCC MYA-139 / BCRC 22969 / CBS 8797 / KCTC 17520 / NBRC 10181 / NCYC 3082 / Yp74L-3) TaxID=1071383 RepID=J7RXL5_HUIN7|nr:hypothetical protein KNAG_0D00800 [Kazachstania naganishii CBS 8797]CCK69832.1 hypothetical protein KNAG_0D00800 [Kazachstania naganishii CBS 8797]